MSSDELNVISAQITDAWSRIHRAVCGLKSNDGRSELTIQLLSDDSVAHSTSTPGPRWQAFVTFKFKREMPALSVEQNAIAFAGSVGEALLRLKKEIADSTRCCLESRGRKMLEVAANVRTDLEGSAA